MFSWTTPELAKKMQKASSILEIHYSLFEDLVVKYQIHLYTPAWDIACFIIQLHLKKHAPSLEQKWVKFWAEERKPILFGNFVYTIPISYQCFLNRKDSKEKFVALLSKLKNIGSKIRWEEYILLLNRLKSSILPIFAKNDFLVFQKIISKQNIDSNIIGEELGMDPSNVIKHKNKLLRKGIIFSGPTLNYNALNLSVYAVIFEKQNIRDVEKRLLSFSVPFLHAIHISKINNKVLLYFITPKFSGVREDLEYFSAIFCEKYGFRNFYIFELITQYKMFSFNYSYYDYKKGKWLLDDILIFSHLNELEISNRKKEEHLIRYEYEEQEVTKLRLDRTGIRVLNHILKSNKISMRQIEKDLGISFSKVRRYVQSITDQKLFQYKFLPNYIFGLIDVVLLIDAPWEEQVNIHRQLVFAPEVYSEPYCSADEKGLLVIVRVPKEIALDIVLYFNNHFSKKLKELLIVSDMYSKRWRLPEDKFETVFQEWKYSRKDILGDLENE